MSEAGMSVTKAYSFDVSVTAPEIGTVTLLIWKIDTLAVLSIVLIESGNLAKQYELGDVITTVTSMAAWTLTY